ncbi:unnamed protein product [Alternaria alternata]
MGSDLGFISDPVNFIDAEVVKYDGTIVMASTEPELMWALRGSGGGFGSVVDMQQNASMLRGSMANFRALPMATATIDEEAIVRAMEWHDKLADIDKEIQGLSMVIVECLVINRPIGGTSEVALPRSDDIKHYTLIITGCPPHGTEEQDNTVSELVRKAPKEILGESADFLVLPPGLDNLQDPKKTYSIHWDKLARLRKVYDPDLRFKALVTL